MTSIIKWKFIIKCIIIIKTKSSFLEKYSYSKNRKIEKKNITSKILTKKYLRKNKNKINTKYLLYTTQIEY